jgi:hypothetical protein
MLRYPACCWPRVRAPLDLPANLPILFDKDPDNCEWTLLATFYTCDAWHALGRPKSPYAERKSVTHVSGPLCQGSCRFVR